MKKILAYSGAMLFVSAAALNAQIMSADSSWKSLGIVSKASELSSDAFFLQFNGKNQTFTVDQDMDWSAKNYIIGTKSSEIGTATTIIEAGKTLTLKEIYQNSNRPDTTIDFNGDGSLKYAVATLNFNQHSLIDNPSAITTQTYNFNVATDLSNKTVNIRNKNILNFSKLATNLTTAFSLSGESTLSINNSAAAKIGTLNLGALSTFNYSTTAGELNITTLSVASGATYKNANRSIATRVFNVEINNAASVDMGKNIWLDANGIFTAVGGSESVVLRKLLPGANSKIVLNSENILKYQYDVTDAVMIASCYTGATVELGANQKLGKLIMSAAGGYTHTDLAIDFNGNVVYFDSFENQKAGTTYDLYFTDFDNGNFRIKDISVIDLDSITVNGKYSGSDLEWSAIGADGYYALNVIPEPATYAVAFGVLAIAFALMRRRR